MSSTYLADVSPPICGLDIVGPFRKLTDSEKLYAHWQSQAAWAGARITLRQNSHLNEAIFDLLLAIVSDESGKKMASLEMLFEQAGLDADERKAFLEYAGQTMANLGNYRSFGSTKFIPRLAQDKFAALVEASADHAKASALWAKAKHAIYALEPSSSLLLGKPSLGQTTGYYPAISPASPAISDDDVAEIQAVLEASGIDALNTRVTGRDADGTWVVGVASAEKGSVDVKAVKEGAKPVCRVEKGDFATELKRASNDLREAKKHVADDNQAAFIDHYIRSFETGSMQAHIDGSEAWIRDGKPVVETYIGFIETYSDPYGARAEWEGFVSIVDKDLSKRYDEMVDKAETFIQDLPWGKDFEVEKFQRPVFAALAILSFATGGIPAGINLPNYPSSRESVGYKNVSLANILAAKDPNEKLTFLHENDIALYKAWDNRAFELQVALHELLGHGSGKVLTEKEDGSCNFVQGVINPLTGEPVTTWYKPGQTYGSVIGSCASSYEECRAEAVALYLVSNKDILKLFQYESKEDQEDVQVAMFLLMARAGVRALEFYDPVAQKHGQAHMQARMGITNALIRAGIAELTLIHDPKTNALTDAFIRVDRAKVLSEGRSCMADLLKQLQIRKAVADGEGARKFYTELTDPLENWDGDLRALVIERKAARKIFVQPNTIINEQGQVELVEYPLTLEGLIQSTVERGI